VGPVKCDGIVKHVYIAAWLLVIVTMLHRYAAPQPERKTNYTNLMISAVPSSGSKNNHGKMMPRTEIWVTDYRNGEWIDARKASYVKGKISPMNYGLGAQAEVTEGALDYSQATAHIMMGEKEHHQHGGHNPMSQK